MHPPRRVRRVPEVADELHVDPDVYIKLDAGRELVVVVQQDGHVADRREAEAWHAHRTHEPRVRAGLLTLPVTTPSSK